MPNIYYHNAHTIAYQGNLDLTAGTFRMMLLTATHAENPSDQFVADIVANEVSDASYARVDVTGRAIANDNANNRAEFTFNDVTFPALNNVTVAYAVLFQFVTNDADSPVVAQWDVPNTVADGSDFTLQVGSDGAIQYS